MGGEGSSISHVAEGVLDLAGWKVSASNRITTTAITDA